jgi:hypothetical protein
VCVCVFFCIWWNEWDDEKEVENCEDPEAVTDDRNSEQSDIGKIEWRLLTSQMQLIQQISCIKHFIINTSFHIFVAEYKIN